ncbi:selenium cofactor biosynthesis protein YqeC [Natrinema thermotolerans]|uniref:Selenium cofactor biosynthesis protein YqeC n=1 Tax=Natrinema thermotolerans TaxID=121872 RepID=A0AAF0PI89_9EURY|nr:selenium cofactor biosynthesis protein YqeC [Natrinema thermotolerans]QCC57961.1 putative selenium-dependent hydroxylase accessory protein YqeC [Natrinema thermotolerans]WMT09058.1 selenium cofactor biosynthesis protein YqeC [Natrinema thermotolerans]
MDPLEALRAESGLVAVVGAGGKKTTLYALAARAAHDRSLRAAVTATVRIPIFDRRVERVVVTDDPAAALERAESWPVGVVPEREGEDRYVGYDPAVVDGLAATDAADLVLVKADGARTREFKAPNDREPQLPASVDTVVPIASVQAVGEPLAAATVHRPERVAAITGLDRGDAIRPVDVARVLASDRGGLRGVPEGATVVPLLNKVDGPELRETATAIGRELLERAPTVSRVVLARMIDDEPIVDVLER